MNESTNGNRSVSIGSSFTSTTIFSENECIDENEHIYTHGSSLRTGADFLCFALASAGVTHVFGGHGGAVVPLIDAIVRHPSLTWVYVRCEVNASQMAMAYGKLTGTVGCCVATSGPGAGHLLSGLVDAEQDRVPLLCITGLKDMGHARYADFQDIDQSSIFKMAGISYSETVSVSDQLLPLARNAFTAAISSHGCAHLAVPVNVQQEKIVTRSHFCLGTSFQAVSSLPATDLDIETLVTALREEVEENRRVIIACGYRAASLGQQIEKLAELLNAPILTSYDGKGTVDERHKLAYGVVGVYGNAGTPGAVDLLEQCQTVIGLCVNDYTELICNKSGLQMRHLIQVESLLVKGDSLRFSPSAVFHCGYLEQSLKKVVSGLEKHISASDLLSHRLSAGTVRGSVLKSIPTMEPSSGDDVWAKLKEESYVKPTGTPSTYLKGSCLDYADVTSETHCHPAVFFKSMADFLDDDSVICADIGDNALFMASSLPAKRGQRFLTSEHLGIMGFSLNSGVVASLCALGKAGSTNKSAKKTLVVAGDGGIQMSINELATLKDHGAKNVLVVVVVNSRLGRVQNESWGPGLNADGCHIGAPNLPKLFEAYGYPNGLVLSTSDESVVAKTIEQGWENAAKHGCCVIELRQDPLVHPIMHKLAQRTSFVKRTSDVVSDDSFFPAMTTSHWADHRQDLMDWLNSLESVQLSDALWFDEIDLFSLSPAEAAQKLLKSLPLDNPPTLFKSEDAKDVFDREWKAALLNAFSAKDLVEEIVPKGLSNKHPLKIQWLACPPNMEFQLHSHPNVELDIPLVGDLWERRLMDAELRASILERKTPLSTDILTSKGYKAPTEEELARERKHLGEIADGIQSLGSSGHFIDRATREGQVLYNSVGSLHQSYTKENGCLIFVLWSGVHANFTSCECCFGIKGAKDLFLPK